MLSSASTIAAKRSRIPRLRRTRNSLPNICTTDHSTEDSTSVVRGYACTNSNDGAPTAATTASSGSMTSSKKTSRIPRLRTQTHESRHGVLQLDNNPTSHARKSASKARSTATYKTRSRIPRLRETTLASALYQIHRENVFMNDTLHDNTDAMTELNPTTNLTGNCTSMDGLLQTSTVDVASTDILAEASVDVSTSVINVSIATDLMNDQLHPANSMDINLVIAKDIEMVHDELFKAFDEFEQNQRKRYEEVFPEFNIQPSDVRRDSPLDTHEEELCRLKAQVASLEMDKATLTQQLEVANTCIADLQQQVLSFESKDTLSAKCTDDPVDVEYARVIAIEQEIDAQLITFQNVRQHSRNSMDEVMAIMTSHTCEEKECPSMVLVYSDIKHIPGVTSIAKDEVPCGEPSAMIVGGPDPVTTSSDVEENLALADQNYLEDSFSIDQDIDAQLLSSQTNEQESQNSMDEVPVTPMEQPEKIDNECIVNTAPTPIEIETDLAAADDEWVPICPSNDRIMAIIHEFLQAPVKQTPTNVDTTPTTDTYPTCTMESNQCLSSPPSSHTCEEKEYPSVAPVYSDIEGAIPQLCASVEGNENARLANENYMDESFSNQGDSTDGLDNLVAQVFDAWITDSFLYTSPYSLSHKMQGEIRAEDILDSSFETQRTSKNTLDVFASDEIAKNAVITDRNYMEASFSIETEVEENLAIGDPRYLEDSFSFNVKDNNNEHIHSSNYLDNSFPIEVDSINHSTDIIQREPHEVKTANALVYANGSIKQIQPNSTTQFEDFLDKSFDIDLALHDTGIKINSTKECRLSQISPALVYVDGSINHIESSSNTELENFLDKSFDIDLTPDDTGIKRKSTKERRLSQISPALACLDGSINQVESSSNTEFEDLLDKSFDIDLATDDSGIKINSTKECRLSQIPPAFVCLGGSINQIEPSSPTEFERKALNMNDLEKLHMNVAKFDDGACDAMLTKPVELRQVTSVLVQQACTEKRPCATRPSYKENNVSKEARLAQPSTCRKMDADISANLDFHLRRRQVHV